MPVNIPAGEVPIEAFRRAAAVLGVPRLTPPALGQDTIAYARHYSWYVTRAYPQAVLRHGDAGVLLRDATVEAVNPYREPAPAPAPRWTMTAVDMLLPQRLLDVIMAGGGPVLAGELTVTTHDNQSATCAVTFALVSLDHRVADYATVVAHSPEFLVAPFVLEEAECDTPVIV